MASYFFPSHSLPNHEPSDDLFPESVYDHEPQPQPPLPLFEDTHTWSDRYNCWRPVASVQDGEEDTDEDTDEETDEDEGEDAMNGFEDWNTDAAEDAASAWDMALNDPKPWDEGYQGHDVS